MDQSHLAHLPQLTTPHQTNERTNSSLNILNQIKIHDFTWKGDTNNNLYAGVFAQELYDIYPHAITKPINETDYWMVDYSKLTPVMIASIQELNLKLEAIAGTITPLSEASPSFLDNIYTKMKTWLADAGNGIAMFFAGEIHVENKLCADDICINKDQLKALLIQAGGISNNSENISTNQNPVNENIEIIPPPADTTSTPTDTPNDTSGSISVPESTPEPEINPEAQTEIPPQTETSE